MIPPLAAAAAPGGAPPAPEWPAVLARWHFEPVALAVLVVIAAAWFQGRRALGVRGPEGGRRPFLLGLATVAVALLSPVASYAEALLSVHMVQHLLLVMVAAPLLVAAHPLDPLLASLRPWLTAELRRAGRGRAVRFLTQPLTAWVVFAATGWFVHFSPLFDLALEHPPLHGAEHALFLGSGLLFWQAAAGRSPLSHPLRLLYVALAMPQNTFLALAISSAGAPLYPAYGELGRTWGPSLLADQRQAGGLMWVAGDVALLAAVLVVAAGWARYERGRPDEGVAGDAEAGEISEGSAGRPPSPRTAG